MTESESKLFGVEFNNNVVKYKICSQCKENKQYSEYPKCSSKKIGIKSECKECNSLRTKKYYQKNIEACKIKNKKYAEENKEYFINYNKKNREKHRLQLYEYRQKNKEYIFEYNKQYRNKNRDRINKVAREYKKRFKSNPDNLIIHYAKRKKYHAKRLKNPLYKLTHSIRSLIIHSFKNNYTVKAKKTIEILGCSFEEFKIHLENQFDENMNWSNQGSYWHMDHIKPISLAKTEQEVYELNHYTNFQPLCSKMNRDVKRDNLY